MQNWCKKRCAECTAKTDSLHWPERSGAGEQLPRWALIFLAQGWPANLAEPAFTDERPCTYTSADTQRFVATLADKLGLTPDFTSPRL
jgi:hypothetical protein